MAYYAISVKYKDQSKTSIEENSDIHIIGPFKYYSKVYNEWANLHLKYGIAYIYSEPEYKTLMKLLTDDSEKNNLNTINIYNGISKNGRILYSKLLPYIIIPILLSIFIIYS